MSAFKRIVFSPIIELETVDLEILLPEFIETYGPIVEFSKVTFDEI
jgi:hypothetical protein